MANRARRSALSAAGLMLIAGCSGGGHSATSLPSSGGGSSPSTLANGAKVTVSITIAQKQALSGRRISNKVRPTGGSKRVPSFVSPSTSKIVLSAMYNGTDVFDTTVYLSQCTNLYSLYQCTTNLPIGTYTIGTSVFDANNNLLGTNVYSNPAPQTIYANGAAVYGNYLYADVAGVAYFAFIAAPINCNTANSNATYAEVYTLDADNNVIVGPLANPITGHVVAVNGAGLGAIDLYAASIYGTYSSADNQVIYDTSVYVPFINFTGAEGSVFLYGFTYNIPALFGSGSNGISGFQAGSQSSPAAAQLTSGTYNLVAMTPGSGTLNVYTVEESVPAIVSCNSVNIYPALSSPSQINGVRDSNGNSSDILAIDGQNIDVVGNGMTTLVSGGVPQVAFTSATYTLGSNETPINLFSSTDVQGRIFVITNNSANSGNGQADQMVVTNGSVAYQGSYTFQFPATSSLRIAGEGDGVLEGLYYTNPSGSNFLYGVDRSNNTQYAPLQMFSSGEIYTLQPSGSGFNYIFFRGYNGSASQYQLCTFDPTIGVGSENCLTISSANSNPVSMRFESSSGDLLAVNGTVLKSGYADVTPASFTLSNAYTFTATQSRFIPGESAPGFVGVYDGTSTTTFLQWNGSSWVSYGSLSWPNAFIVPLH